MRYCNDILICYFYEPEQLRIIKIASITAGNWTGEWVNNEGLQRWSLMRGSYMDRFGVVLEKQFYMDLYNLLQ